VEFLKIYSFTWNGLWNNKGKNEGIILNITKAVWTQALNGGAWSTSHPDCFTTGERTPCTLWITGLPQSWYGCSERRKDLVLQFLACLDLGSLMTVLPPLLIHGKTIWLHVLWHVNYNQLCGNRLLSTVNENDASEVCRTKYAIIKHAYSTVC